MLALIAGQGNLPTRIASRLQVWPLIAALEGYPPQELIPEVTFRIETLGTLLQQLADRGVHQVCFAGGIERPNLDSQKIDAATAPLVPRLMKAMGQGDDAALRAVLEIFESAGFEIVSASDLLGDFVADVGLLTHLRPSDTELNDAARGTDLLAALSHHDIGQGCVIAKNQVIAIETLPGTDWMLSSLAGLAAASKGVLVKMPKVQQDQRIDMPTIGPETVRKAHAAGLAGIVIAAGAVMVVDADEAISLANKLGLFILAQEVSG